MKARLAQARKAAAALAALLAQLVAAQVLHGTAELVAEVLLGIAGLAGVYRVRNDLTTQQLAEQIDRRGAELT